MAPVGSSGHENVLLPWEKGEAVSLGGIAERILLLALYPPACGHVGIAEGAEVACFRHFVQYCGIAVP